VLAYQKRGARIAELREELELQVALHLERQSSIMLRMIGELQVHAGIATSVDAETLDRLKEPLDPKRLMEHLREQLTRADGDDDA
jgi:hypothetical protein